MSKKCKVLRSGIRQRDGKGGWKTLLVGATVELSDAVAADFASASPPMVEVVGAAEKKVEEKVEKKKSKFKFKKKEEAVEEKAAADEVAREKDLESDAPETPPSKASEEDGE
jgi:hypothetical protein